MSEDIFQHLGMYRDFKRFAINKAHNTPYEYLLRETIAFLAEDNTRLVCIGSRYFIIDSIGKRVSARLQGVDYLCDTMEAEQLLDTYIRSYL
jgi:hypothetical protein